MDDMSDKYRHTNTNQSYQEENQDGKRSKTEFIDHTPPDPEEQQNQSPDSQVITWKTKTEDTAMIIEEDDRSKFNTKNEMEEEFGQLMFSKTCLLQANGLNQFILIYRSLEEKQTLNESMV